MRRSRLLPGRAAGSGCPGSITGVWLIDVSARHHERKIGVLIAQARVTRCPLRTQLSRADQPKRPLDDVLPIAEGQPVPPLGRGPVHAHQGLQPGGVDQLNCGEIDDQSARRRRWPGRRGVARRSGVLGRPVDLRSTTLDNTFYDFLPANKPLCGG